MKVSKKCLLTWTQEEEKGKTKGRVQSCTTSYVYCMSLERKYHVRLLHSPKQICALFSCFLDAEGKHTGLNGGNPRAVQSKFELASCLFLVLVGLYESYFRISISIATLPDARSNKTGSDQFQRLCTSLVWLNLMNDFGVNPNIKFEWIHR